MLMVQIWHLLVVKREFSIIKLIQEPAERICLVMHLSQESSTVQVKETLVTLV